MGIHWKAIWRWVEIDNFELLRDKKSGIDIFEFLNASLQSEIACSFFMIKDQFDVFQNKLDTNSQWYVQNYEKCKFKNIKSMLFVLFLYER